VFNGLCERMDTRMRVCGITALVDPWQVMGERGTMESLAATLNEQER